MHMIRAHDGKSKIQRRLVLGAWGLALLALFGLVVMVLWNWLMPALFDLPGVSYWQALGLLCPVARSGRKIARRIEGTRRALEARTSTGTDAGGTASIGLSRGASPQRRPSVQTSSVATQ